MTLRDLSDMKAKYDIERNPSVPAHARYRTIYTDKTANGLTKCIKDFCDMSGILCDRTGSEGRFRQGKSVVDAIGRTRIMKGTWIPGHNVGQGDLQIVIKGRIHSVEVKIGKDRQSEVQRDFQERLERAGGIYTVVKDWDDFYKQFMKWKK